LNNRTIEEKRGRACLVKHPVHIYCRKIQTRRKTDNIRIPQNHRTKRLQFDKGPYYYTFVGNCVNLLYANSVQMRTIAVINRVITLNDSPFNNNNNA